MKQLDSDREAVATRRPRPPRSAHDKTDVGFISKKYCSVSLLIKFSADHFDPFQMKNVRVFVDTEREGAAVILKIFN